MNELIMKRIGALSKWFSHFDDDDDDDDDARSSAFEDAAKV